MRLLLDMMQSVPAFVLGRRMDVLAWNALAEAVNGFSSWPTGRRNVALQTFLDPAARTFYPQWDTVAAETVAFLQLDAGRHPGDPLLAAMVGELSIASPEFARLWERHDVQAAPMLTKTFRHPVVGEITVDCDSVAITDRDQRLVLYSAPPGSRSAEALALLNVLGTESVNASGTL